MEKEKKNNWIGIIAIIGLVIICLALVASQIGRDDTKDNATLSVSGTSELSVDPNQAIMYINILTEETTAEKTQNDNRLISNKVMDALKVAGIDDQNIETSNYYLSKKYGWDSNSNKNIDDGYSLTHTIKVTTTNISDVGSYIDKSIAAGANGVDRIEFSLTTEKEQEVRTTALAKATLAAKDKASNIAKTAGVHLKKLISVSENEFSYMPYYANIKQSYDSVGNGVASSNIAPQKVDITASIQVIYEIESKER